MVPFEAARFGFHRFGSSSTMADVFEEDEEDDGDETATKATGASTPNLETPPAEKSSMLALGDGADATETGDDQSEISFDAPVRAGLSRTGSDLSEAEKPQVSSKTKAELPATTLHSEVIEEEAPPTRKRVRPGTQFRRSPSLRCSFALTAGEGR